ncbi:high affinity cationic amino acid transporter 1-like [Stegodyphus dumicola]|uniref:high affinity cationic amino acid transporter 1-like n=1 Tax=Stegodyphus dumicola TaxID=202533 RepID=UPI0015ACFE9C|nr:high affinity cationic amino acid transporter 1-like [Stegodyphus dumicola]XP_035232947.1 high affinity cationic amino acid transporter 1-like [Stegodyphus dumicola]XP_035232954.1 high affinity cationic amino acid transporter 1-like [Stegodyphus dumicola]
MPLRIATACKALSRKKFVPDDNLQKTELNRCLSTWDLTFLGVGSTLGLGIYILIGQIASETAGPAVALSYFIAAVASVFAALCYAEFGARVPKAGSAYVYSYVTVGEFMAFVIGWNLVLEYVIGTASVARGYGDYIDSLINGTIARHLNHTLPIHVSYLSSYPDFLAFGITLLLTVMLAFGVKESTRFNNVCTVINLLIVTYAVLVGCFKADVHNWKLKPSEVPAGHGRGGFFPFGFHGVMTGAATCFYGYVGFDCIASTGEEAKNPQRSIPIAIVSSLMIVFCAYFSVSTIQTLMWPYYDQFVDAPLPYVFEMVGYPVAKWVISIGALTGLSTSLLGGMFPLPRILYAMGNDGLIFRFLAKTHPKFKTPMIATFISGIFAGVMAMMFNVKMLADMMSIGTLLAYSLVALSVLILRYQIHEERIPLAPLMLNGHIPSQSSIMEGSENLDSLDASLVTESPYYIKRMAKKNLNAITSSTNTMLASTQHYSSKDVLLQIFNIERIEVQTALSSKVSMWILVVLVVFVTVMDIILATFEDELFNLDVGASATALMMLILVIITTCALARQPSDQQKLAFRVPWVPTVPVLSISVNFYLMLKLPQATWYRFLYWMIAGLSIYFGYGIWNSNERKLPSAQLPPVIEGSSSESEYEERKTEISPLLSDKR